MSKLINNLKKQKKKEEMFHLIHEHLEPEEKITENMSPLYTLRKTLYGRTNIVKCHFVKEKTYSTYRIEKNIEVTYHCYKTIKKRFINFLLKRKNYAKWVTCYSLKHSLRHHEKGRFKYDIFPTCRKMFYTQRKKLRLYKVSKSYKPILISLCSLEKGKMEKEEEDAKYKWHYKIQKESGKERRVHDRRLIDLIKRKKEILRFYYKLENYICNSKKKKFKDVINYLLLVKNMLNLYQVSYINILKEITIGNDILHKNHFENKKSQKYIQGDDLSTFSFTNTNKPFRKMKNEKQKEEERKKIDDKLLFIYLMTLLHTTYYSLAYKSLRLYQKNWKRLHVLLQILFLNDHYVLCVQRKNCLFKNTRDEFQKKRKMYETNSLFYKSNFLFYLSKTMKYANTIFLSIETKGSIKEKYNVQLSLLLLLSILLKLILLSYGDNSFHNTKLFQTIPFNKGQKIIKYKNKIKNLFLLFQNHFMHIFLKKKFYFFFEFFFVLHKKWKGDKTRLTFNMLVHLVYYIIIDRWKSRLLYRYYTVCAYFLNLLENQKLLKQNGKQRDSTTSKKNLVQVIPVKKKFKVRKVISRNNFLIHMVNKYFLLFIIVCYSNKNRRLLKFSTIFLKILIFISLQKSKTVELHFYELKTMNFLLRHLDAVSKRKDKQNSTYHDVRLKRENTTHEKNEDSFIYNTIFIPKLNLKSLSNSIDSIENGKEQFPQYVGKKGNIKNFSLNNTERRTKIRHKKFTKKAVQCFLKELKETAKCKLIENTQLFIHDKKMYEEIFLKEKITTSVLMLVYSLLLSHDKKNLSHCYFNEKYYTKNENENLKRGRETKVSILEVAEIHINKKKTTSKNSKQRKKCRKRDVATNIKKILNQIFFFDTYIKGKNLSIMKILQLYIYKKIHKSRVSNGMSIVEKLKRRIVKDIHTSYLLNFRILVNLSIWDNKNAKYFNFVKRVNTGMYGVVYKCTYSLFKEYPLIMKVINVKKEANENYLFLHIFNEISCLLKFQGTNTNICQIYTYGIMKNGNTLSYFILMKFYHMDLNNFINMLHKQYSKGLCSFKKEKKRNEKKENMGLIKTEKNINRNFRKGYFFKKGYFFRKGFFFRNVFFLKKNIYSNTMRSKYKAILIKISSIILFHLQFLLYVLFIFIRILESVKVLHKNSIIHFDISAGNILIDLEKWDFLNVRNFLKNTKHDSVLCFYKNICMLDKIPKGYTKNLKTNYLKNYDVLYIPNIIMADFGKSKIFHNYQDFSFFQKNRGNENFAAPELTYGIKKNKKKKLQQHQQCRKQKDPQIYTTEFTQSNVKDSYENKRLQSMKFRNDATEREVKKRKKELKKELKKKLKKRLYKQKKKKYFKSDVWLLGCLLHEMLTNKKKDGNDLLFLKITQKQEMLDKYTTIHRNVFYKEMNKFLSFFFQLNVKKRKNLNAIYKDSLRLHNFYINEIVKESELLQQLVISNNNQQDTRNRPKSKRKTSIFKTMNTFLCSERKKALKNNLDTRWESFILFLRKHSHLENEGTFNNTSVIAELDYFVPLSNLVTKHIVVPLNDLIKHNISIIDNFYFIYVLNKETRYVLSSSNLINATVYSFGSNSEKIHFFNHINIDYVDVQRLYLKKKKFYMKNKNTRNFFMKLLQLRMKNKKSICNKKFQMIKIKTHKKSIKNEAYFFLFFFINLIRKLRQNGKTKNSIFIIRDTHFIPTVNFLRKPLICKNFGILFLFFFLGVTVQLPLTQLFFIFQSNSAFFFSDKDLRILKQIIHGFLH